MPGYTMLIYNNPIAGVNDANVAMTAATDPNFTQDGAGNYRFTEDYKLLGAAMVGTSVTFGRFQNSHWNALGEFDIFAANRSLEPPATPWIDWYRPNPLPIPKFESFKVQDNNNLGSSTEIENCLLWIQAADGLWPVPPSGMPIKTIAKIASFTPTLNAWSVPQAITFNGTQRPGVYAIIGAVLQMDDVVAFRFIFPRYRMYNGRQLRPGFIAQNAVGNNPSFQIQREAGMLGEAGRFWSFELPQVEVFATAADAGGGTLFLDMLFLGENEALASQGSGGGSGGYSGTPQNIFPPA